MVINPDISRRTHPFIGFFYAFLSVQDLGSYSRCICIFPSAHQYPTSEILPFSTAMCFLSAMLLHLSPPKTCNIWKAWRTLRDTCGFAMFAVEKKHSQFPSRKQMTSCCASEEVRCNLLHVCYPDNTGQLISSYASAFQTSSD